MKPLKEKRMLSGADLVKRGVSLVGLHGRAVRNTTRCDILRRCDDGFETIRDEDDVVQVCDIPKGDPIVIIGSFRGLSIYAVMTPSHGIVSLNSLNMDFPDEG